MRSLPTKNAVFGIYDEINEEWVCRGGHSKHLSHYQSYPPAVFESFVNAKTQRTKLQNINNRNMKRTTGNDKPRKLVVCKLGFVGKPVDDQ